MRKCFSFLLITHEHSIDFVLPKLFKKKRYVICPLIDIANHKSIGYQADVSFEVFLNSYSLAISSASQDDDDNVNNNSVIPVGKQIFISYGDRSNDQLLQFYGFIESNNPYDVYIMPPLREWNITAMEQSCGRQFVMGRLALLEQAGLLGNDQATTLSSSSLDPMDDEMSVGDGVVVTRADGVDPCIMQAIRVLVSTNEEWMANGAKINAFLEEYSGGELNEKCTRLAVQAALQAELNSKSTTIDEDISLLTKLITKLDDNNMLMHTEEESMVLDFRIEKKKLLQTCIKRYQ
jgi:Rubisco LSMT substrate-binding